MLPLPAMSRRSRAVARPGWHFELWAPIWAPSVGGLSPEASAFAMSLSLSHAAPRHMGSLEDTLTNFLIHILNPVRNYCQLSVCDVIVFWTLIKFRIIVILGGREGLKVALSPVFKWRAGLGT